MRIRTWLLAALALAVSGVSAAPVELQPDASVPGRYSVTFDVPHSSAGQFADRFDLSPVLTGELFAQFTAPPISFADGILFEGYALDGLQTILPGSELQVTIGPLDVFGLQALSVFGVAAPFQPPRTTTNSTYTVMLSITPVPEPATSALLIVGLCVMSGWARRKSGSRISLGLPAEAVGFEPTEGSPLRRFSRPVPSTARPRFRGRRL